MKINRRYLLTSLLLMAGCVRQPGVYNIQDYGARGDGKTVNTAAINKAIRACNQAGGGTVLAPAGRYITGTIELLSNVDLHLDHGAVLFGSSDTMEYRLIEQVQFDEGYNRYGLIFAERAINFSISGYGEINGNGTHFMYGIDRPHMGGGDFDRRFTRQGAEFMKPGVTIEDGPVSYPYRPGMMVTLEQSENIHISGVTFKDSPEWTMRISDCENVHITGISILNNKLIPNSDGIHCTTSRNVRISDCHIFAGDDAIIVTGFGYSPMPGTPAFAAFNPPVGNRTGYAENVTVSNCVLSSRSAGIRVGYGRSPIRHLLFSNLVIYDSNRGIGVFARDGSRIEDVHFNNITIQNRLHSGHWWGKGEPIHISTARDTRTGTPGRIDGVYFDHITAESEAGIIIWGCAESPVRNIHLRDVRLSLRRGRYSDSYGGNIDLRPAWPVDSALFKQDLAGFYARYVHNLQISGLEIQWAPDVPTFFTYGLQLEKFKDVLLENVAADPAPGARGLPAALFRVGSNLTARNCYSGRVAMRMDRIGVD